MEAGPPKVIEAVVRTLVPPASREHVLGDLRERYVSPGRYVIDALHRCGLHTPLPRFLDDVLAYLAAHRDAASFLKPESWRTLHTPPFGGEYAMGWVVRSDGERWHNGSNTLWYAEALFNKDSGVAAAAAGNEAQPKTGAAVGQALLRAARAAA
jgi:hypothetical protein